MSDPNDTDPRIILRDEILRMVRRVGEFRCEASVVGPDWVGKYSIEAIHAEDPVLSVCMKLPLSSLHAINHVPRCKIIFASSNIQLYLSRSGQESHVGNFQYEDPDVITQLFHSMEQSGITGIHHAEHIDNGPRTNTKTGSTAAIRRLARFRDRRQSDP